jgi:hypothetical protein
MPISKSSPNLAHWLPLIDKMKIWINSWGTSWLNLAGKLVLIKLVLSSIPIYLCSILFTQAIFFSKFESLLRHFLWKGGKNNENKLPLVS